MQIGKFYQWAQHFKLYSPFHYRTHIDTTIPTFVALTNYTDSQEITVTPVLYSKLYSPFHYRTHIDTTIPTFVALTNYTDSQEITVTPVLYSKLYSAFH